MLSQTVTDQNVLHFPELGRLSPPGRTNSSELTVIASGY